MTRRRLAATIAMALAGVLASSGAAAQSLERCNILCVPELLIEPTWTIENLAHRPRVVDSSESSPRRLPRERVFELVLAVDVPTRWRRIGFTAESIFAPGSQDNEIELELELNTGVIQPEQTGGWLSSHFDVVDQFGRPNDRATGLTRIGSISNWTPHSPCSRAHLQRSCDHWKWKARSTILPADCRAGAT